MTALLILALLLPEHGGKHLMDLARSTGQAKGAEQKPMVVAPAPASIFPPATTNAPTLRVVRQIGGPVAIVRPPSTNWVVRPLKVVPGGTNLWRLDKSTDLGRTWTMIRSNLTGTASTTNSDVWDADRLPNVWYRIERQARFYQFSIP